MSRPALATHSTITLFHLCSAEPFQLSSMHRMGITISWYSSQPPGASADAAERITVSGDLKQLAKARPWIKSNFCGYTHGFSASSISKLHNELASSCGCSSVVLSFTCSSAGRCERSQPNTLGEKFNIDILFWLYWAQIYPKDMC